MFDKTFRAAGALVVLVGIGGAALAQMGTSGEPSAVSYAAAELNSTAAPQATTPSTAAEEPEPTTTTVPEPFVYRMGVLAGVTTDNFWAFYGEEPSVWNAYMLGPTKPALYASDPTSGALVPELARELVAPIFDRDGWRVLVRLNPDLEWSDGEPITAEDVEFTFETVRRLGLRGGWAAAFPDTIVSVSADSSYQLRIEFSERPSVAVWPHAVGTAPVMPAHIWAPGTADITAEELYDLPGSVDVSGGPLTLAQIGDDVVISVANPGYPLGRAPEQVEYRIYPAEEAAVEALDTGEIDYLLSPKGLTQDEVQLLAENPDVALATSPSNGVRYLGFNLQRAPMSQDGFRRALALLLDRDALSASDPYTGPVAYAFTGPENPQWYDPDVAGEIEALYAGDLEYRLNAAIDALVDEGYSWASPPSLDADGNVAAGSGLLIDGVAPPPVTILTAGDAYDPSRPRYAQAIAEVLGWLGFDARPVETDFDTVVDLAFNPGEDGRFRYDMYLLGWTLGNPGLPGYFRALFATDGELNNSGYSSEEFEAQLAEYEDAYTVEQAREALWSMEMTLARDLPYLLLFRSQITEAYRVDRVAYTIPAALGGIQGRLGGVQDVIPAG
ncbi:MAG: ABC transporter substrate-binding protein [Acidimicrobiia bacterium]